MTDTFLSTYFLEGGHLLPITFIQSLYGDNPHTAKEYAEMLAEIKDPSTKQRLMFGNWEYDDDPTKIFDYDKIIDLLNLIIEKHLDVLTIVSIFGLSLPFILALTIPMAILLASIMSFGRLSVDNELIAFKSCGINIFTLLKPTVIAALFLPEIGKKIAVITGLGQTFVGNIFIAFSTSLPEVVVSIAAVKIGASDMAIGNLFGSNILNIAILAIDDVFFINGPLLSYIEPSHIVPALSAIIMMTIAIIGLIYRASKKTLFLSWDSLGIVAVYILNLIALYILK